MGNRRLWVRGLALLGALQAAALAGCEGVGGGRQSSQEGPPQQEPPPVQVVVFQSRRVPIAETLSLVGTLAANEAVEITTEIDGIVERVAFEEGEPVGAGQLLVELDEGKLKAALGQARANLQLAKATRTRFEGLGDSGAVSRQEVDQAVAEFEAAQASLELAEEQLRDATLTAPFEGVMGARLVSPGQFVARGTPLVSLIDPDPMKAEFRVPERFLSRMFPGQQIELKVAAYPDQAFSGQVYFIEPQIDEGTRTALVKAKVPNPEGNLKRGMFANLKLIMTVREEALVVPEAALMWQGDSATLFVVNGEGRVELRQVQPGLRQPGVVEITEGLNEGEAVVVEGMQKLGPGSKVEVRP